LHEIPHSRERQAAIDRMQAKLRKLDKKRAGGGSDSDDSDEDEDDRPKKKRSGPSLLDQELAKYSAGRRGKRIGKRDEEDVLSALSSFAGKIRRAEGDEAGKGHDEREEEGLEVDDDVDWIGHALKAPKDTGDETRRAESDYTVRWARGPGVRVLRGLLLTGQTCT
jgi:peptidyl-prolyl cis-trans isomerase SDCCAG10